MSLLFGAAGCGEEEPARRGVVLVTEEEAAQPDEPVTRQVDRQDGPRITVIRPDLEETLQVPFPIEVSFEPRDAPIDLSSLKVHVLKFVRLDITERVLPYVSAEGISMEEAWLPSGRHRVRIRLDDTEENRSTHTLVATVR